MGGYGSSYQLSMVSSINQSIGILVILSNCPAMIRVSAQLGILSLYFSESALEAVH